AYPLDTSSTTNSPLAFSAATCPIPIILLFIFRATSTTSIPTLSLRRSSDLRLGQEIIGPNLKPAHPVRGLVERSDHQYRNVLGPDRKSTRLNSSHVKISYAVFCLKKKTEYKQESSFGRVIRSAEADNGASAE